MIDSLALLCVRHFLRALPSCLIAPDLWWHNGHTCLLAMKDMERILRLLPVVGVDATRREQAGTK